MAMATEEASQTVTPHFNTDISAECYLPQFLTVLKEIRPEWKPEEIVFKESPKGVAHSLVNTMIRCYRNGCPEDSIMLRIHSTNEAFSNIVDRKVEPTVMKYLGIHDCAPRVVATFQTGFCYQFVHGEVLSCERLHEELIWRGVATELAKMHACEVECPPKLVKGAETPNKWIASCWETYPEKFKDPVKNERFQKELPPKETLKAEIDEVWDHALSFNPDIVLCHNDTRAENIVWNPETAEAKLVDFEVVCYNYRASEIAAHFLKFGGNQPTDFSLIPDEELQLKWLRVYLEKYFSVTGRKSDDVTEKDVSKLYVQVSKFILALTVMGGLGGLAWEMMQNENSPLDGLAMAIDFVKQYYKLKDKLLALKMAD